MMAGMMADLVLNRQVGSCHAANCFIAEGPSDTPQNQPALSRMIRAGPYQRFIEMGYHGNTFI
jgi:hypothetical protein